MHLAIGCQLDGKMHVCVGNTYMFSKQNQGPKLWCQLMDETCCSPEVSDVPFIASVEEDGALANIPPFF